MKKNFQKVINDKDVDHLSFGWSKKNGFSVLIKMYNEQVATCHWFDTLEDMDKWLEEEAGVVKKPKPVKMDLPLPPPIPLPGV